MTPSTHFPRPTPDNHRETSPATKTYNCIAWAAGDTGHWWEPGVHWQPPDWPGNDHGLGALEYAFRALGYVDCGGDAALEPGFNEVALYGGVIEWTHAARQLPSGGWTSKLGKLADIEHDTPDVVAGGAYGEVMQIMKRPDATRESVR